MWIWPDKAQFYFSTFCLNAYKLAPFSVHLIFVLLTPTLSHKPTSSFSSLVLLFLFSRNFFFSLSVSPSPSCHWMLFQCLPPPRNLPIVDGFYLNNNTIVLFHFLSFSLSSSLPPFMHSKSRCCVSHSKIMYCPSPSTKTQTASEINPVLASCPYKTPPAEETNMNLFDSRVNSQAPWG